MECVKAKFEILTNIDNDVMLKNIELAARTCYKSEDKICEGSAEKLVRNLVDRGHDAMLEHSGMISVRFTVDRGVSHEAVRHRPCSFAQESTRYVNYGSKKRGCKFIEPCFFVKDKTPTGLEKFDVWMDAMLYAEQAYNKLIDLGCTPQEARTVLPHSIKTEVVISTNVREWLHIFELRTSKAAHPQIREVMIPLLKVFQEKMSVIFNRIEFTDEMQEFYNKYCVND